MSTTRKEDREFSLSSKTDDMDIEMIYGFLKTSYWAKGISQERVKKAIHNSLCFGVFTRNKQQVAFARVITDTATFAYLADVFVIDSHRGRGISKFMLAHMLKHPQLQGLRRFMLATKDAHGLYEQFGFTGLARPEILMENAKPNVYAQLDKGK